jgi:hypothetical protein
LIWHQTNQQHCHGKKIGMQCSDKCFGSSLRFRWRGWLPASNNNAILLLLGCFGWLSEHNPDYYCTSTKLDGQGQLYACRCNSPPLDRLGWIVG